MKRKIKSAKGFTLAELLIVVAIIAVLVAIGIPIFTSQLEKSREAVDLSDVRSAYAEVMMAAITGDTTAIYTKDANQKIYNQAGNVYSITVKPLKQKQDGWQTALPITIGGVSSTDNVHWVGTPGANGECVITYIPPAGAADEAVKFTWSGGTGGGISGGNSGPGEDNGNNGTGGDNNKPDVTPDSGKDNEDKNPDDTNKNNNISSVTDKYGYFVWPDVETSLKIHLDTGQIIYYKGEYYTYADFSKDWDLNEYYHPLPPGLDGGNVLKIKNIHPTDEVDMEHNPPIAINLSRGDLYIASNGHVYAYKGNATIQTIQTLDTNNWIDLKVSNYTNWS